MLTMTEFINFVFFFFKQKTAYEMRISDWSSDVCSSDLDYEKQKAFVEQEQEAWQEGQVWAHRRDAFEAFYVAMLRGEFTDYKERDRRWNELRRSFAQAGIQLPDYPKDDTDLERLLVRSEERRVGKEWFSTWRNGWWRD